MFRFNTLLFLVGVVVVVLGQQQKPSSTSSSTTMTSSADWIKILETFPIPWVEQKSLLDFLVAEKISVSAASQFSRAEWVALRQFGGAPGLPALGSLMSLHTYFRNNNLTTNAPIIPKSSGPSFKKDYKWIRWFQNTYNYIGFPIGRDDSILLPTMTFNQPSLTPRFWCELLSISSFDGRVLSRFQYANTSTSPGGCPRASIVENDFNIFLGIFNVNLNLVQVWTRNGTYSHNITLLSRFVSSFSVDSSGRVLIVQNEQYSPYTLSVFPPNGGKPIWQLGPVPGLEHSICGSILQAAVDSADNIMLLCPQNLFQLWNSDGKFLRSFTLRDTNSTFSATSFLLDGEGNIAVTSYDIDDTLRILFFSPQGSLISSLGIYDAPVGKWSSPSSIAMDSQGNLFVGSPTYINVFG